MPPKLREWVYLPRQADLARLFDAVRNMSCVSVVGVSNLGKSATLRALADQRVQVQYLGDDARDYLFIYMDFNQMLEMSDQAFYELVLRCSIDAIREHDANDGGAAAGGTRLHAAGCARQCVRGAAPLRPGHDGHRRPIAPACGVPV